VGRDRERWGGIGGGRERDSERWGGIERGGKGQREVGRDRER